MTRRSRAPLAVGAILATTMFFASLMAMSLAAERPSVAVKHGKTILGDPTGSTEAKIWLLAVLPSIVLMLAGVLAMRLGRLGVAATALAAIALMVAILIPTGTWASRHANRFPVGVDLIPPAAGSEDIYLKGEWERRAKTTVDQVGGATIGIALAALALSGVAAVRRRRVPPPVAPMVELAAGGPPMT